MLNSATPITIKPFNGLLITKEIMGGIHPSFFFFSWIDTYKSPTHIMGPLPGQKYPTNTSFDDLLKTLDSSGTGEFHCVYSLNLNWKCLEHLCIQFDLCGSLQ